MAQQREDTPKTGPAPSSRGIPLDDDRRGGEGTVKGSVGGSEQKIKEGPGQVFGRDEPVMDPDADARGKPQPR